MLRAHVLRADVLRAAWLVMLVATVVAGVAGASVGGQLRDFVPVGVRYEPPADAARRQRDLEEMRRLHFNVVSIVQPEGRPGDLSFIDRLLAGAPFPGVLTAGEDRPALISTSGGREDVTIRAWSALARGARAMIFDDWAALGRNTDALTAAADFAEAVTRNAALYAPLRPRVSNAGAPDIRIDGGGKDVEARLLESSDALALIGLNHARESRSVVITFSTEIPEAIWRNMFTGGSVSFVTGREGPTYRRTFAPREVLVLAISKTVR